MIRRFFRVLVFSEGVRVGGSGGVECLGWDIYERETDYSREGLQTNPMWVKDYFVERCLKLSEPFVIFTGGVYDSENLLDTVTRPDNRLPRITIDKDPHLKSKHLSTTRDIR